MPSPSWSACGCLLSSCWKQSPEPGQTCLGLQGIRGTGARWGGRRALRTVKLEHFRVYLPDTKVLVFLPVFYERVSRMHNLF